MRLVGSATNIPPHFVLLNLVVSAGSFAFFKRLLYNFEMPFCRTLWLFWKPFFKTSNLLWKPFFRTNSFCGSTFSGPTFFGSPLLTSCPFSSFFSGQCAMQCHPLHLCGLSWWHLPTHQAWWQPWAWPWVSGTCPPPPGSSWWLASQAQPLTGPSQTLQKNVW